MGAADVAGVQPVPPVFGEGHAELGELAVRVTVQASCSFSHCRADGGPDVRRNTMGVLVDVQEDGNIQLRRTVGCQAAEITAEGKPVQAF